MRRAQDLCRIAENRGVARYSGFLSDREQKSGQGRNEPGRLHLGRL